jgi:hypothetical protein
MKNNKMWHVVRMGDRRGALGCCNLEERDHLEDLGIDGRIIVKLFLKWTY